MIPRKLKPDTLRKLRKRKLRTWSRIAADRALLPAHRLVMWFVLDNITKSKTALRYEDEGRVYINPSQEGLAAQAGVDRRLVGRAIEAAIGKGYLERTVHGNGFTGNSEYRVLPLKKAEG